MNKSLTLLLLLTISIVTVAQEKPLTIKDYGKWSRVIGANISNDGNWMSYGLRPNGGDDTLFIQNLNSEKLYKIKYASAASFSENSNWVSYLVRPTKEEEKKLRKNKKPIHNTAGLLNLKTGEKFSFERADKMDFSNTSQYFVVSKNKPADDNIFVRVKRLLLI